MAVNGHSSHAPAGMPDDAQLAVRNISMEEAFARQSDRISYLRSMGQPWDEAVYDLRDILVGLEDAEFWDGIPDKERARMDSLPYHEREALKEKYAPYGWGTQRVRAFPGRTRDGKLVPIYRPTAENLSQALRIVRRLATRKKLTWRTKTTASLHAGMWNHADPDGDDAED